MTTPVLTEGVKAIINMEIEAGLQDFKNKLQDAVLRQNVYECKYKIYSMHRNSDYAQYNPVIEHYIIHQLGRVKAKLCDIGNTSSPGLPVVCLKCLPDKRVKSYNVTEMWMRVYIIVHPSNAVRFVTTSLADCPEHVYRPP
jgi:hypothetical protein